jgi:plastocyanin
MAVERSSRPGRTGSGGWRRAVALAAAVLALSLAVDVAGALASPEGGARASATASVTIPDFSFKPATLRVAKGTRVSFVNSSNTTHTATRKGSFTTGRIKPGKSVTIKFAQKGTFAYHCMIHPFMRGKIVVD